MRNTTTSGDVVINSNGELIGVCLGFDFCAEHEWGIKDLHERLGCKFNKFGFDRLKVYNKKAI